MPSSMGQGGLSTHWRYDDRALAVLSACMLVQYAQESMSTTCHDLVDFSIIGDRRDRVIPCKLVPLSVVLVSPCRVVQPLFIVAPAKLGGNDSGR